MGQNVVSEAEGFGLRQFGRTNPLDWFPSGPQGVGAWPTTPLNGVQVSTMVAAGCAASTSKTIIQFPCYGDIIDRVYGSAIHIRLAEIFHAYLT